MKKFFVEVNRIMNEVLSDVYHDGWATIFELFFTALADSNDAVLGELVAEAVTDYICEELPDDFVLNAQDVETLYTMYEDYADSFERRVREHIVSKVHHGDLCEVA